MQEVWREQLDDLLSQVAEYADDWQELVAQIESLPENKQLHEYLSLLVPRLKRMQRAFNRVTYDTKARCYVISNYDYKLYWYFKRKYPQQIVITPYIIAISTDDLSDADREQMQKQMLSSL